MNIYDWDDTIYRGDSTFDFIKYLLVKRPKTILNLPLIAYSGLLYGLKKMPKQEMKENIFHMFQHVKDMEKMVDEFTRSHLDHVKKWYILQQKGDDLVISASPEFLIQSFCDKLGIQYVMASPVDIHTGKYYGLNCHGEEKVRRLKEKYPDARIDSFYSDSYSDSPLAKLAKEAYLVKGDQLEKWIE
ncbi:MAG: HAD-IB family phosphatase [Solobacterium sp.]|nr:HAD-IB family phosphatase [Solobacterium sp.]